MDLKQSRVFYRKGYLKVPEIVSQNKVEAARKEVFSAIGSFLSSAGASSRSGSLKDLSQAASLIGGLGKKEVFLDLFNKTKLKPMLEKALGSKIIPVRASQLAILFPGESGESTNEYGYLDKDTPHYGWTGHLDGLWNGGIAVPPVGSRLRGDKLKAWNSTQSTNGVLKENREFNCNIMNFTALIGVALSDQRAPGSGNLGVLRAGHRHMEQFFRYQLANGGPLGPDGPGWERENRKAPNRRGLGHYPRAVRDKYIKQSARSDDGEIWPKPDFLRLKAGDAVIVHSLTPHSASKVVGASPRLMVYFRCVSSKRPEENLKIYPQALCDSLLEWRGVKRQLAK